MRNGYHIPRVVTLAALAVCSAGLTIKAEQRRPDYWTQRQFDAQEKHIDSVDAQAQKNKDITEEILVRIEGDEKLVIGGAGIISFLLAAGALSWYLRLISNDPKYRRNP